MTTFADLLAILEEYFLADLYTVLVSIDLFSIEVFVSGTPITLARVIIDLLIGGTMLMFLLIPVLAVRWVGRLNQWRK